MKILLLKFRNIGDVLLITPLVSNLKAYYKDAQIGVAVNHHTEPMINLNPNINKVIIYERVFAESRSCQPYGQDGCDGTKISDCLMTLDMNIIKSNIKEMLDL